MDRRLPVRQRRGGGGCVWRRGESWTGRRFHLGCNKEVFDAETFAIYQELRICDEDQRSGHRYTIFSDSQAAIQRIRSDGLGPGQHWARAAIDVCSPLVSRQTRSRSCGFPPIPRLWATRWQTSSQRRRRVASSIASRTSPGGRQASRTSPEWPRRPARGPRPGGSRPTSGQTVDTGPPRDRDSG